MLRKLLFTSSAFLLALFVFSSFKSTQAQLSADQGNCPVRVILNNTTKTIITSIESRDDDEHYYGEGLGFGNHQYVGTFMDSEFLQFELLLPAGHVAGKILLVDIFSGAVVDYAEVYGGNELSYVVKATDPGCRSYYRIEYVKE